MGPKSLRKHFCVLRLARGLPNHYRDLCMYEKDRTSSKRKGRGGRNLFPYFQKEELSLLSFICVCSGKQYMPKCSFSVFCLMLSKLHRSMVWYLSLTLESSQSLLLQIVLYSPSGLPLRICCILKLSHTSWIFCLGWFCFCLGGRVFPFFFSPLHFSLGKFLLTYLQTH